MRSVTLAGSRKTDQPFKTCSKCGGDKEPSNGIQMSPTKWFCMRCWLGWRSR